MLHLKWPSSLIDHRDLLYEYPLLQQVLAYSRSFQKGESGKSKRLQELMGYPQCLSNLSKLSTSPRRKGKVLEELGARLARGFTNRGESVGPVQNLFVQCIALGLSLAAQCYFKEAGVRQLNPDMQPTDVLNLCARFSRAILVLVLSVLVILFLTLTYLVAVLLTLTYLPRAALISKLSW